MLIRLISTAFGTGYSPIAPGTAGSLLAVLFYWFIPWPNVFVFSALTIALFVIGVYTSTVTEREFVGKWGEEGHDPKMVVIDEVVGIFIAFLSFRRTLPFIIAGFLLFRLFDILKPFPANKSQNLPGGWGIMLDDVIAGVYTFLIIEAFYLLK